MPEPSIMKCVPKSSVFAESVFGRLDQMLKQKPNTTTLAAEAYIMFSQNKTMNWLEKKGEGEREKLLKEARKESNAIRERFKVEMQQFYYFLIYERFIANFSSTIRNALTLETRFLHAPVRIPLWHERFKSEF